MMNRLYWDNIAPVFEREIFNVCEHDLKRVVYGAIEKYGSKRGVVSDIGCGIGNFLPQLSAHFNFVLGVDFSPRCIARAKERFPELKNVSYILRNLGRSDVSLPAVDVAFSVNSIISPSLTQRLRIFDVVCEHIKVNGHIILVVPSIESKLLTDARLIEWNLRNGVSPRYATRKGFRLDKCEEYGRINEGIIRIRDVDIKHFIREEVGLLLNSRGFEIVENVKIEYSWETEFESPPEWMKDPCPWDWLFVGKKTGRRAPQVL